MADKATYTAGTSQPELAEDIASSLELLTVSVSPLLMWLGFPNNLKVVGNPKHEWGEDELLPNSGTVNGAIGLGVTTIVLDAPQGLNFKLGDLVQIEGSLELMTVVAPTPTATNVEVVRGERGTTAVAIPDNAVLKRINDPAVECETAPDAINTKRSRIANYTEIFRRVYAVCETMERSDLLFGITSELAHQKDRAVRDKLRDIAHTIIRSKAEPVNPQGTDTQPRVMNGIIHSILAGSDPAFIDAGGAGLSESLLNQAMEAMAIRGGNPSAIAVHHKQKRRLSALMEGRQRFRPEDTRLGAVTEVFVSDFGEVEILKQDLFVPEDSVLILDEARIELVKHGQSGDPFRTIALARTGLAEREEIVAELGLEIRNAGSGGHALLRNLSIT